VGAEPNLRFVTKEVFFFCQLNECCSWADDITPRKEKKKGRKQILLDKKERKIVNKVTHGPDATRHCVLVDISVN
jgi:hypothetical protein